MAQRLPTPGSDDGTWGSILNAYLSVSHNNDGTLQTSALTQAGAVTSVNNKTSSNGAVTLTASDVSALPTTTALAGLHDTAGASDGQVLAFNQTSGQWVASTVPSTTVNDASGTVDSGVYPFIGVCFIFCLQDSTDGPFGITRIDGTPKAAYSAIAAAMTAGG